MKTGVEKIVQMRGGDPEKNKTGVDRIIELLGGDPPAKNQTGVDKIVEILENGGGGGNPNSVQVINGTLINPFRGLTTRQIEEIHTACFLGNADVKIEVDATTIGYEEPYNSVLDYYYTDKFVLQTIDVDGENISGLHADWWWSWDGSQPIDFAAGEIYMVDNNSIVDLKPYATGLPTTLTIIWHPLPTP